MSDEEIIPKRYLVTASDSYYPRGGMSDWIYHGPLLEEALDAFNSSHASSVYLIDLFTGRELDYK